MKHAHTKPSHLNAWGDGLLNKLSSRSRTQRKRQASKQRRAVLRKELGEL